MTVDVSAAAATIREQVAHIARGCRSGRSHNPAVHEREVLAALVHIKRAFAETVRERDAQKIATDTLARRRDDLERALGVQGNEWKRRAERAEQQLADANTALASYETAVRQALKRAPNHWHEYRDPFELWPGISDARRQGCAALAAEETGQ